MEKRDLTQKFRLTKNEYYQYREAAKKYYNGNISNFIRFTIKHFLINHNNLPEGKNDLDEITNPKAGKNRITIKYDDEVKIFMKEKADSYYNGNENQAWRVRACSRDKKEIKIGSNQDMVRVMENFVTQLKKIGTNINQITKICNETKSVTPDNLDTIFAYLENINTNTSLAIRYYKQEYEKGK